MAGMGANCVISLGGGSTTGPGKGLALRTGVGQICIPTTYAGSEMTPILGETKDGLKTTIRSADVLPETVIYDVDLTMTLPPGLSAVSGMNAIARSVDALYARDRNPIISLMAQESIRALADALPKITINPGDVEGRTEALTVPGSRESALAPSIWPCITSSVTRSADRSTFHTLKPIPSFCRTPSPTTLLPLPPQWTPFAGFSAWKTPLLAFTRLQGNLASHRHCRRSACRKRA